MWLASEREEKKKGGGAGCQFVFVVVRVCGLCK